MQNVFGKDFEDSNPIFRQILCTLDGGIPVALGYLREQGIGRRRAVLHAPMAWT